MRHFAKCSPKIWIGKTGKAMRKLGPEVSLAANYLMNNPHANMLGVYYLPIGYMSIDTCLSYEQASQGIDALCQLGFCHYDEAAEYIWVVNMARDQVGENLKSNDNRIKCIQDLCDALPDLNFLNQFYQKYQQSLHLKPVKLQPIEAHAQSPDSTDEATPISHHNFDSPSKLEQKSDATSQYKQGASQVIWHHEHSQWLNLSESLKDLAGIFSYTPLQSPFEAPSKGVSGGGDCQRIDQIQPLDDAPQVCTENTSSSEAGEIKDIEQTAQKKTRDGVLGENTKNTKPLRRVFEAPLKPLRSQEKEKEKDKEKEKEKDKDKEEIYVKSGASAPLVKPSNCEGQTTIVAPEVQPCDVISTRKVKVLSKIAESPLNKSSNALSDVEFVFSHWQTVMHHSQAKLDKKRKWIIREALKMGYGVMQLCDAISGCAQTPFNMGENERGQRYDSLQLILRDADQIDRFIQNHVKPPQTRCIDPIHQNNLRVMERILEKDERSATDPAHLHNIALGKAWVQESRDR